MCNSGLVNCMLNHSIRESWFVSQVRVVNDWDMAYYPSLAASLSFKLHSQNYLSGTVLKYGFWLNVQKLWDKLFIQ